jgi:uncharacterized membrane protein
MSEPTHRWIIKRNCSASPLQLALVLASIVLLSFLIGVAFAAAGLWLVLPFVGLELLAVGLAFFCYGRHAADYERIEVDATQVRIERHDGGTVVTERLSAPWARVEVDAATGGDLRPLRLYLAAHGARIEIGRHLAEARRGQLAKELRQALQSATARA